MYAKEDTVLKYVLHAQWLTEQ